METLPWIANIPIPWAAGNKHTLLAVRCLALKTAQVCIQTTELDQKNNHFNL